MTAVLRNVFAATLIATTMQATPATAQQTSMFILDASGSMWGRLPDRQTKISAARKVMGDLVGPLPASVSAGLIAYGHRRKGDCSDIEVVQEPQKNGGAAIANNLGRLVPRGKTPISDALKLAGQKLTGIEDPTTIVLVSDGIETCKGDPCAVAEALSQSSAKLKIHVVGFAVNFKARAQLQCIAKKGRGTYFTADTSTELSTALTRVTESIKSAEPIKVDAPTVGGTATSINVNLTGPGTIQLKLGGWTHMPKYWKVVNPETGEVVAETKKSKITVPAGQYQIAWRHLEHGAKEVMLPQVIDVKPGKTSIAPVTTGLQLVPPRGLRKPYYWQLLPKGSDLKVSFRKREPAAYYWVWDPVPVPPGEYTLVMRQSEHGHQEAVIGDITLKEGQLTQVPLDQGLNLQWPKSWGRVAYLKIVDEAGRSMKMKRPGPIALAPGKYKLAVRRQEHHHNEASFGEITVPDKGFVDAALTSGIQFDTKIKGEYRLYAVNLDTKEVAKAHYQATSRDRWGPMPLGPGRYRFDLQMHGSKRKTIIPELTIKRGQFIKAKM